MLLHQYMAGPLQEKRAMGKPDATAAAAIGWPNKRFACPQQNAGHIKSRQERGDLFRLTSPDTKAFSQAMTLKSSDVWPKIINSVSLPIALKARAMEMTNSEIRGGPLERDQTKPLPLRHLGDGRACVL